MITAEDINVILGIGVREANLRFGYRRYEIEELESIEEDKMTIQIMLKDLKTDRVIYSKVQQFVNNPEVAKAWKFHARMYVLRELITSGISKMHEIAELLRKREDEKTQDMYDTDGVGGY